MNAKECFDKSMEVALVPVFEKVEEAISKGLFTACIKRPVTEACVELKYRGFVIRPAIALSDCVLLDWGGIL